MSSLRKEKINFTQVANYVLYDDKLSLKAKGLYAYLFSKPEGWEFSSYRIAEEVKDESRSIQTTLRELEQEGYLERKRRGDGKVDYLIRHKTLNAETAVRVDKPNSRKSIQDTRPRLLKEQTAERAVISNTENKVILNTYTATKVAVPSLPFSWTSYLKAMDDHGARHVQIIAHFFKAKKIKYDSKAKAQVAIKRHLRAAKKLIPFSDDELVKAFKKTSRDHKDVEWTIDTVVKVITK